MAEPRGSDLRAWLSAEEIAEIERIERPPLPKGTAPDVVDAEFGTPEEAAVLIMELLQRGRDRRDRGEVARSPEYL